MDFKEGIYTTGNEGASMTKDETLKMALEALEPLVRRAAPWGELDWLNGCKAITAIKEALAQPEEKYRYGTPLLDAFTKEKNTHDS